MIWDDFETDGTYMQELESAMFDSMALPDIYTTQLATAKLEMLDDLEDAWGIESDDADFQSLLDAYTRKLTRALAYKQLHLHCHDNDAGVDSMMRYKANYYNELYDNERQGFVNMYAGDTKRSVHRRVLSR